MRSARTTRNSEASNLLAKNMCSHSSIRGFASLYRRIKYLNRKSAASGYLYAWEPLRGAGLVKQYSTRAPNRTTLHKKTWCLTMTLTQPSYNRRLRTSILANASSVSTFSSVARIAHRLSALAASVQPILPTVPSLDVAGEKTDQRGNNTPPKYFNVPKNCNVLWFQFIGGWRFP